MTARVWMCNKDFKLILGDWLNQDVDCECGNKMDNVAIYDRRTGFNNWCEDCDKHALYVGGPCDEHFYEKVIR